MGDWRGVGIFTLMMSEAVWLLIDGVNGKHLKKRPDLRIETLWKSLKQGRKER